MERTIIVCKAIEVSTLQVENPRSEVMVNTVNAKKNKRTGMVINKKKKGYVIIVAINTYKECVQHVREKSCNKCVHEGSYIDFFKSGDEERKGRKEIQMQASQRNFIQAR